MPLGCVECIVTQVSKRDILLKEILSTIQYSLYKYIEGILILLKFLKTLTIDKPFSPQRLSLFCKLIIICVI
jgi:hypothetical protein